MEAMRIQCSLEELYNNLRDILLAFNGFHVDRPPARSWDKSDSISFYYLLAPPIASTTLHTISEGDAIADRLSIWSTVALSCISGQDQVRRKPLMDPNLKYYPIR